MPDKRILIVEDETIVAMTIEDALQEMGYSVVGTVSTAEDAIKMAGDARPDLILMDIRIQGEKDGIAAARRSRRSTTSRSSTSRRTRMRRPSNGR